MNKREVGKIYENLAVDFLKKQGFKILEQNYKCKYGEIDIIALDKDYLVFIEVKYRKSLNYGYPAESVDINKIKHISKVAQYYLLKKNIDLNIRFDVVEIIDKDINLIKNAFEVIF